MMSTRDIISLKVQPSYRIHGTNLVNSVRLRTLTVSSRAIHQDTEYYDSPEEFRPERYEDNEYGFRKGLAIPEGLRKTYGFGAGRRICPGQHLAENSLVSCKA